MNENKFGDLPQGTPEEKKELFPSIPDMNFMLLRDIASRSTSEWKTLKELGIELASMSIPPRDYVTIIQMTYPKIEARVLSPERMSKEYTAIEVRRK